MDEGERLSVTEYCLYSYLLRAFPLYWFLKIRAICAEASNRIHWLNDKLYKKTFFIINSAFV